MSVPISRKNPASKIEYHTTTDCLVLRPTQRSDVYAIQEAVAESRQELVGFMPWAHTIPALQDQLDRLKHGETEYWAGREMVMGLFEGSAGFTPHTLNPQDPNFVNSPYSSVNSPEVSSNFIAMIGLHPRVPLNPAGLEVGYWCRTSRAGRGMTTIGVKIAMIYAFDYLGCDRFQVMHDEANVKSRRVIEKCGFSYESTLRNLTIRRDDLIDGGFIQTRRERLYALTDADFSAEGVLPWIAEMRPNLRYFDIAGNPLVSPAPA